MEENKASRFAAPAETPAEGSLAGRHIVLGITGSIAAYKACFLVRLFVKAGAEVQVVMTPAAKEFVTPLTLATLTSKPVVSAFFSNRDGSWHSHVALGLWADAMVVAPCTASTLAKMATGVADNMLCTTYLSMKAPVVIAPAMDSDMYVHPATQQNLDTLRQRGNYIVEPGSGFLASGLEGKGRMEEPEAIAAAVTRILTKAAPAKKLLAGKRILITAGPTYERIDPVRFIGNYSSGKMGFALAEACAEQGATVELIAGPVALRLPHPLIHRTDVETTAEMYAAAVSLFPQCQAGILAAAVADFTPEAPSDEKVKRTDEGLVLRLRPTCDIAAALSRTKTPSQRLVGFALETNDELVHAREKLLRKGLDFIVMNSLREEGAGFRCDTNKITLVSPTATKAFPLKSKREAARDIVSALCALF